MNDPFNTSGKLEKTTRLLLSDPNVLDANKKLILKFQEALFAGGLSPARVEIYIRQLRHVARLLNKKSLEKASKKDIIKVLNWVERQPYTKWTKATFRVVVKRFFTWLGKTNEVA